MPGLRETTGALRVAGGGRRLRGELPALLLFAAVAGVLAAVLALPLQAATAEGASVWSALDRAPDVLSTRFGLVWGLGALLWLVARRGRRRSAEPAPGDVGAPAWPLRRRRVGSRCWRSPACRVSAATPARRPRGGAAARQRRCTCWRPARGSAASPSSCWRCRRPPAGSTPPDRTRLLTAVVSRFSGMALIAVAALVAAGVLQAVLELDAVDDLWDTGFGRAVLVKSAAGGRARRARALNRRRTVPGLAPRAPARGARRAGHLLRRALRVELALGARRARGHRRAGGHSPSARRRGRSRPRATSAPPAPSSRSSRPGPAPTRSTSTCSGASTAASTTRQGAADRGVPARPRDRADPSSRAARPARATTSSPARRCRRPGRGGSSSSPA